MFLARGLALRRGIAASAVHASPGVSGDAAPPMRRALLCGFWGSVGTVRRVMAPYVQFYADRGFDVRVTWRTPYESLLCGFRDRRPVARDAYDVVHCMSGGSFTALNYMRGGMAVPRKLIFEGGPMLGTQQEAVNFLASLYPRVPEAVHWRLVRGLLVPGMRLHHGHSYTREYRAMLDVLHACPDVLVLNGTADRLIDRAAIATTGAREILFADAAHNRIRKTHPDAWARTVDVFIRSRQA